MSKFVIYAGTSLSTMLSYDADADKSRSPEENVAPDR